MANNPGIEPESQFKTTTKYQRGSDGRFVSTGQTLTVTTTSPAKSPPPLVNFQLTNPVIYLKSWWSKIIGNEGMKLTLQIKPLTAMTLTLLVSGMAFGLGRLTLPAPIVQYVPILASPTPVPSPDPWRETAFSGKLQVSGARYYLITTSIEAITLEVPHTINLQYLVGKRIMAVGRYNKETRTMVVSDAKDLEILPATPIPLPTVVPTLTPLPAASSSSSLRN